MRINLEMRCNSRAGTEKEKSGDGTRVSNRMYTHTNKLLNMALAHGA